ncbi:PP2C family protein-serine/threonine phosphatase [Symbioplanes lichenis]|uniref:PP2C family protein-serine/threonine phosphatase n=1 Tax=Symbioplanes lichenis TaxID=1629072 RepID=UPI00273892BA|nr:PP2C family protein-serine/threonine phosphatase [Actinoplanes lichenis]
MDGDSRWFAALREILAAAHLWRPERLAAQVSAALEPVGLSSRIWLADYEQVTLRELPSAGAKPAEPLPIDSSLAGRAFARVRSLPAGDGHWYVPMVDATDRIGVMEFTGVPGAGEVERCELVAGLIGHLIATTTPRSDHLDVVRRSQPMSPASELLWRLLPPLTASSDSVVISAVVRPCYDVGGDGFDYVLDGSTAYLVIMDAVGRGLAAGLACAVALAAIRATRRAGGDLAEQARAADAALAEQFADVRFVTAVLAELDVDSGRLRYCNAGHPRPLVLRGGRSVRELTGGVRLPLGVASSAGVATSTEVAVEMLQPGDRLLLHTDGVTEARTAGGDRFGVGRLVDLVERHADAGLPAPETVRRLAHAIAEHQGSALADDATLMLVQWSGAAAARTVPVADRGNDA